jgi:hypothetical protein
MEAAALQIGYIHFFNCDFQHVVESVRDRIPEGFCLRYTFWHDDGADRLPAERVRLGQYRVRSGDPEMPVYLVRKATM